MATMASNLFKRGLLRRPTATTSTPSFLRSNNHILNLPQTRQYQLTINNVKVGQLLHVKDRICMVLKTQHHMAGRGSGHYKLELRDVVGGSRLSERFNSGTSVEGVKLEEKSFQFLYVDDKIHVLDEETMEEHEFDVGLLAGGDKLIPFLTSTTPIKAQYYEGKPVIISGPEKATYVVEDAPPPASFITNEGKGTNFKQATLNNGVVIQVPEFIKIGDEVVVDVAEGKYVGRSQ